MTQDKRTIGITDRHASVLDSMVSEGRFEDAIDAAKFAMGLAIREDLAPNTTAPSVDGAGTKWNVGSFDPDGDLKTFLMAVFPEVETPYRMLEYLIDQGLQHVSEHIADSGVFDAAELLRDRPSQ